MIGSLLTFVEHIVIIQFTAIHDGFFSVNDWINEFGSQNKQNQQQQQHKQMEFENNIRPHTARCNRDMSCDSQEALVSIVLKLFIKTAFIFPNVN